MQTLNVRLGARSYPIQIGSGLIGGNREQDRERFGNRVAIVSNDVVAPIYMEVFRESLQKVGVGTTAIVLPDGERYKDWETLNRIYDQLLAERGARAKESPGQVHVDHATPVFERVFLQRAGRGAG